MDLVLGFNPLTFKRQLHGGRIDFWVFEPLVVVSVTSVLDTTTKF